MLDYFKRKLIGRYYSINELDKQLERYLNYDFGFFVELGANDGFSQSNSLYFEKKRKWRGILVEPSLHNFFLCKQRRSKNNHVYCNACVGFEYKEKYVDIRYADLMSISEKLDLDIFDQHSHMENARKHLAKNEEIVCFGALAATLDSLLKRSKAPREIDFMSLDVEGAELEVLKGIDYTEYSFKYMLIEVRDLDRIESFLKPRGYELEKQFSSHDYLFKHVVQPPLVG